MADLLVGRETDVVDLEELALSRFTLGRTIKPKEMT